MDIQYYLFLLDSKLVVILARLISVQRSFAFSWRRPQFDPFTTLVFGSQRLTRLLSTNNAPHKSAQLISSTVKLTTETLRWLKYKSTKYMLETISVKT